MDIQKDKKTVLVVEDDEALMKAISEKLKNNGFATVSATSVNEARNELEDKSNIDAIWLDHYLVGGENGIQLMKYIKHGKSRWEKLPIFLISNNAEPDKVKEYLEMGVKEYYTKADNKLENIIKDVKEHLSIL